MSDDLVEGELQVGVDLFAGEEHAVGFVIHDGDGLFVHAVHAVDEAADRERAGFDFKLFFDGQDIAVIHHSLAPDKLSEDVRPFFKRRDAHQSLGDADLRVEFEGSLFGERRHGLLVHHLLVELLENGVDDPAELERHVGRGLGLVDIVQLEAERTLLESTEPGVAQMVVFEFIHDGSPFWFSLLGRFSKLTMRAPGNTSMAWQIMARCSGVISLRVRSMGSGTNQNFPSPVSKQTATFSCLKPSMASVVKPPRGGSAVRVNTGRVV
jgi:hypothetical protein